MPSLRIFRSGAVAQTIPLQLDHPITLHMPRICAPATPEMGQISGQQLPVTPATSSADAIEQLPHFLLLRYLYVDRYQ